MKEIKSLKISNEKSFNDFLFLPLMFIKVSEVVLRERNSKFL